jgi:hypothetical protein
MSVSYPLYDNLVKKADERADKQIDIRRLAATINNIARTMTQSDSNEHYEELHAIILHYEMLNNGGMLLSPTPFDPKVMECGKGILYYVMNLPPQLQQILTQYIYEYSENDNNIISC